MHAIRFKERIKLRNEYASKICKDVNNKTLVFEFDYAQNIALPKLNVNSQYYKRQLNLYVFNVHCFNAEESKFFCFLECEGGKNANSVCSFLYDSVSKMLEKTPDAETIIFLSDSCGGQNKNKTMIRFCSWLSAKFNKTVTHLFPIRGHSYCQCDRNFGNYGTILKKCEKIETPNEYLAVMRKARATPSPFEAEMSAHILEDWDTALEPLCLKTPKLKGCTFTIQKYVKLTFNPSGVISAYKEYNGSAQQFKIFKPNFVVRNKEQLSFKKLPQIGISDIKKKIFFFLCAI